MGTRSLMATIWISGLSHARRKTNLPIRPNPLMAIFNGTGVPPGYNFIGRIMKCGWIVKKKIEGVTVTNKFYPAKNRSARVDRSAISWLNH